MTLACCTVLIKHVTHVATHKPTHSFTVTLINIANLTVPKVPASINKP